MNGGDLKPIILMGRHGFSKPTTVLPPALNRYSSKSPRVGKRTDSAMFEGLNFPGKRGLWQV
jgi:hypothetical protein